MDDTAKVPRKPDGGDPRRRPLVDDELADQLLGKAQSEGVELLGPDGLLSQLTKAVLERALAEEMTGHLGRPADSTLGGVSGEREQTGTPSTRLVVHPAHPRGYRGHRRTSRPALAQPGRLDDATVARIIRMHQDQADDVVLFQNQADRWNAVPCLRDPARRSPGV